jgi:hypothetical protein
MVAYGLSLLGAAGLFGGVVNAQFPPKPEGLTVLESQLDEGVRISYKEAGHFHVEYSHCLLIILRLTSAKPPKASEASPVMFISQLGRLQT